MQAVKGMENSSCRFLSYNKLNIVDKNINVLYFSRNLVLPSLPLRYFDQFVGKLFTGNVKYFAVFIMINNEMSNRMHQMSFSQTCTAIDKERIVGVTRGFGTARHGRVQMTCFDYRGRQSVFADSGELL